MFGREDLEKYLSIFTEECKEHIMNLNEALYILEKEYDNKAKINEIFRAAHSIKGAAGTMGFSGLTEIMHEFETLLGKIREESINLNQVIIDISFRVCNIAEKYLNYIEKNGSEPNLETEIEAIFEMSLGDYHLILEKLKELYSGEKYETGIDDEGSEIHEGTFEIIGKFADEVQMRGVRLFIILKALKEYGKVIKSVPHESELKQEKIEIEKFYIYFDTKEPLKKIESIFRISDIADFTIQKYKSEEEETKAEEQKEEMEIQAKELNEVKHEFIEAKKKEAVKVKEYIKVEKERLDDLMDAVGELVIDKSRYSQMQNQIKNIAMKLMELGNTKNELRELLLFIDNFKKLNKNLERESLKIQDSVTNMRMVPIKDMFSRFKRNAREIASKLGKDVEVELFGEETELDKVIIEGLNDPLMHMIRNSIDHGIETMEERKRAGKYPKGKLVLQALNVGNDIIISLSDDGKGIDEERVVAKAVKTNIISEERARGMTKEEKLGLIFLPGFSTAENISNLSGRGVGMDVVKSNIEKMKGRVDIESNKGEGTTVSIKLPLTLAITRALLFIVGDWIYSISLDNVVATIETKKTKIDLINDAEVIQVRNTVVPIYDMREIFNLQKNPENEEKIRVVILRHEEKMYGFKVDKFIGQQEIVVKNIEGNYHRGKGILGATILGDGKVSMVIDNEELIEYYICKKEKEAFA